MKIIIESIPHSQQAYETCGDWRWTPDGTLHIRVSEEMGAKSCSAVILHELFEVLALCKGDELPKTERDLLTEKVDCFDKNWNGDLEADEPGDDPKAPYHREHSLSTAVERIAVSEFGMSWKEHEKNVEKLFA